MCRVYKRPGVEDHPSVPRSHSTRHHHNHNHNSSSSSSRLALRQQQQHHSSSSNLSDNNLNNNNINNLEKLSTEYSGDGSTTTTTNSNSDVTIALANQNMYRPMPYGASNTSIISTSNQEDDETAIVDDLQRLVNYQITDGGNINHQYFQIAQQFHQNQQQNANANALQLVAAATTAAALTPQTQAALAMNMIPAGTIPNNSLWDMWNPVVPDGNRDHYTNIPFK